MDRVAMLLLVTTLSACADGPPSPSSSLPAVRLDVDAAGEDLAAVMERVGRQAAVTILVARDVEETVTVSLREVPWREAVDLIARMTGCEVEELPGGAVILRKPVRVSIQLRQADVRTLLEALAAHAHAELFVAPEVQGRVDVALHDVTPHEAMREVVRLLGDGFCLVGSRDEPLLRVVSVRPAERVDLDVADVDLADVMERIGRMVERNILVAPDVQESVTVSLHDVPWREAVEVIARMTRCDVEERPGGILVLTRPPRVTIQDAQGNDVRTILALLASYLGLELQLPPELRGDVTSFDDVIEAPVLELLNRVAADAGEYDVELDEGVIRVTPRR